MQKIKKNLSAIEQQFQKLKHVHKNNEIPTKIGEVAEIMTYGVVSQNQVNEYLLKENNQNESTVNQNWLDMSIQSMIIFFDKVIKDRNLKKPQQGAKKQRRNILSWQKIKTKMSNKEAHQNPFRPHRLGKQGYSQNSEGDFTEGTMNFGSEANLLSHINQNADESGASDFQEQEFCKLMDAMHSQEQKSVKYQSKKNLQDQLTSDLPTEFSNFSLEQKFNFLRTSYDNGKNKLQKKFDMIYTHYRKQMYIRRETFKTNQDLMIDLKTFLKYYRQFQIAKKYKVNKATNYFKKLAINSIWLDQSNFSQLHYILAEMVLDNNEKQIDQRLKIQGKSKTSTQNQQLKQLKKLLSKATKVIMQNLIKLKDLSEIISDEKVKKLLNDNRGKSMIKKIVEVHSGFVKEDILERLKQRIQEKKKKNDGLLRLKSSGIILKTQSPEKTSSVKEQYTSVKANPSFRSIYRQLLLPNLASGQMKKASIYSSLQLINIHKQKQKLRQLIDQNDNQKYLEAYFKKQKILSSLFKPNNLKIKTLSQTPKSYQLEINTYRNNPSKSQRIQSVVKKSLSLPRMKFT